MRRCENHTRDWATVIVDVPTSTSTIEVPLCDACADRIAAIAPSWPQTRLAPRDPE